MICNVCQKNPAIYDEYWGYLPCQECQDRQSKLKRPGAIPEFVGEDIKLQRQKFHKDIHWYLEMQEQYKQSIIDNIRGPE